MSHSIFFGRDSKNSVPIEAPRGANLYDFIEDAARHLRRQIKANLNIREEDFERLMGKPVRDQSDRKPRSLSAGWLAGFVAMTGDVY